MITKKTVKNFIGHFLFFFSAAELLALHWARTQYPMQKAYNVFFVVKSDTKGHDSGTLLSFLTHIIVPVIILYGATHIVLLVYYLAYRKIHGTKPSLFYYDQQKSLQYGLISVISATVFSVFMLKAWNYPAIFWEVHKKPEHSEFYEKNYVPPSVENVVFPEKKRNLVYIFIESMESSYTSTEEGGLFCDNLIPRLTELGKSNCNFSGTEQLGGGYNLEGTSWTAAGIISKMSGLPYFAPFSTDRQGKKTCLPGAVTLTDILKQNGYTSIFSIGSDKQFENRDLFLENHGMEIHDINWYKQHGDIPQNYQIFWGFEDEKLYTLAKKELTSLAQNGKPFCYGMLTVDSHFPDGYRCPRCPQRYDRQIMNVMRCADTQAADFVAWIQQQSWYENTVIVIVGDHCYLNAPDNNFIEEESPLANTEKDRRWLDIIINSSRKPDRQIEKNRKFSPYDMFPTVLESMGCTVKDGALAFGRSLYSGNKTLVEEYGADRVNSELMQRTVEYEALKKPSGE